MIELNTFSQLFIQNQDSLITLVIAALVLFKTFAWGNAKGEALDKVVQVIEILNLDAAKKQLAVSGNNLSGGAADALQHAVNKADPKRRPIRLAARVAGEVLRGVVPRP